MVTLKAKLIIALVCITIISVQSYALKWLYDSRAEQVVKTNALEIMVEHLAKSKDEQRKLIADQSIATRSAQSQLASVKDDYNELRNKEDVVVSKPLLVNRCVSWASRSVFLDISCSSGNNKSCESIKAHTLKRPKHCVQR